MKKNKFEKRLSLLFKIFNNRPNHLAQFLIENNAFDEDFIKKVTSSNKLSKIKKDKEDIEELIFVDYDQMNDYFKDIIEYDDDNEELEKELNNKLFDLLENEEYEEAAKLRDYMKRKKMKIII